MENNKERWEILTGIANDEFAVSNFGRILNMKTRLFVRPYIHKSRSNYYLRVKLGKQKYMVHVLVARTYLRKPTVDHCEVHHIDWNTLNPKATNLAWETKNFNKAEAWRARRIEYKGQSFTASHRPFRETK